MSRTAQVALVALLGFVASSLHGCGGCDAEAAQKCFNDYYTSANSYRADKPFGGSQRIPRCTATRDFGTCLTDLGCCEQEIETYNGARQKGTDAVDTEIEKHNTLCTASMDALSNACR
eukprot:TRINITY_DN7809_c0_g1_i1.p2 TRINITY_DN7809_c0_g1~~TRINITY_DN7809_c0_g1_i1.p2  ORF type:complete len:118 (+),score=18.51 TRINITY_DN7809_c0_g1_i1:144-497(+)